MEWHDIVHAEASKFLETQYNVKFKTVCEWVPRILREKRRVPRNRMVELEEVVRNCTKNELMNHPVGHCTGFGSRPNDTRWGL